MSFIVVGDRASPLITRGFLEPRPSSAIPGRPLRSPSFFFSTCSRPSFLIPAVLSYTLPSSDTPYKSLAWMLEIIRGWPSTSSGGQNKVLADRSMGRGSAGKTLLRVKTRERFGVKMRVALRRVSLVLVYCVERTC